MTFSMLTLCVDVPFLFSYIYIFFFLIVLRLSNEEEVWELVKAFKDFFVEWDNLRNYVYDFI